MILVLSDPTPIELEILKKILGKEIIELAVIHDKDQKEWLSPKGFEVKLEEEGYSCKTSITRKRICETWGIKFIRKGRNYYFSNIPHKIPNKTVNQ